MSRKIVIDRNKCIGCGLCIHECTRLVIELEDETAVIKGSGCNMCGHCIAICPSSAVSYDSDGSISMPESVDDSKGNIDPEELLYFIKKRRSIRAYEEKDIPETVFERLLEAGRFSPTGGNVQSNRFIILRDSIAAVRDKVLSVLKKMSEDEDYLTANGLSKYRNTWGRLKEIYAETGEDRVFYKAPCVILFTSKDTTGTGDLNAGIAASRVELLAYSLGLGACYIGFLRRAVDYDPELRKMLGLREDEQYVTGFSLGYPKFSYRRMVERDPADVRFL